GGLGCRDRGLLGQLDDLQRACAMREALDEAALLEAADQPMNARLGLEVERLFHLLERRRDAGFTEALVDEEQQLMLFLGEHSPRTPAPESLSCSRLLPPEQNNNDAGCSSLVLKRRQALLVGAPLGRPAAAAF